MTDKPHPLDRLSAESQANRIAFLALMMALRDMGDEAAFARTTERLRFMIAAISPVDDEIGRLTRAEVSGLIAALEGVIDPPPGSPPPPGEPPPGSPAPSAPGRKAGAVLPFPARTDGEGDG